MSDSLLRSCCFELYGCWIDLPTKKYYSRKRIVMKNQSEILFAKELWKLLLEIEDFVREHYRNLVDQEIYDLHDDNNTTDQF